MLRADDGDQWLDRQHPMHDIGGQLIGEQPDEGEVDVAVPNLVGHPRAAGVLDGDFDPRMTPVELGQRLSDSRRGQRRGADHAEPQPAGQHAGQRGQFGAGELHLCQHRAGAGQQQGTGGGQPHRSTGTLEEQDAVLPLQARNLVAQRRLHDVTPGGCLGEAQLLGNGDEVLELPDIHLILDRSGRNSVLDRWNCTSETEFRDHFTPARTSPSPSPSPSARTPSQPIRGRRLVLLTVLLGGFTAFGPLSMDLYLPAFPQLAADLGASQAAVQLTLTADVIGIVVGQLVLGPMSDAWGRRRLLLGSTLVCAVASVLCALSPSAGLLVVWRFVQGASGGGGIVLARAIAADIASGVAAARLFSLFMTLSSVAPIVAPVIGGAHAGRDR